MVLTLSSHARNRYCERIGARKEIKKKVEKLLQKAVQVELKPEYKTKELERLGEEIYDFRVNDSEYYHAIHQGKGVLFVVCSNVIVTVFRSDFTKWQRVDGKPMFQGMRHQSIV